ncbi:MAG: hypothetical protein J6W58_04145 [Lachnospiraceae bacterium]|nr:hypothetical protein [Lachnospiraceae bacterium]
MKRKTAFLYACIICMTLSACAKGEQKDEAIEVQIESIDTEAVEETNASTSSGQTAEVTVQQPTKERKPIKVAVMGVPAEEILKKADESLINSNYLIEPVICTDYDQPNAMVLSGEADASLYENQVFLDSYNKKNSTDLEIAERIYYEPLALFGGSISDLSSITNNVKVAVIKGDVNKARALYLLEQKGLIELKQDVYYQASMEDVISNPHNISLEEVDFDSGWPDTSSYGLIICDYNRAMLSGIDPASSLGDENRNSGILDMFSICLVTDKSKVGNDKTKQLIKALNSKETEEFIKQTYHDSVVDYR